MAFLINLSQMVAGFILGYSDETLSAASYRLSSRYKAWMIARNMIDAVFFWDTSKDAQGRKMRHCELSYISEKLRRQLPNHYWELKNKDPH